MMDSFASLSPNRCLPQNWANAPLGAILPLNYGKARSDQFGFERTSTPIYGSNGAFDTFNRALTHGPTLIVGRKGAAGSIHYSPGPCWAIDTAYFTEGNKHLHLTFFRYLLESLQLVRMDRSTAIPSLSRDDYESKVVGVPPLNEQRRIVAKIEELFSELDKGIENLKQARAQLAVYRQALLKHAFEGKLTAAWRAEHREDKSGWSEIAVGDILIGKPTNGRSVPDRSGGFRVLRLTSIKNGYIDLTQNKEGAWTAAQAADQILNRGDFLISRGNGSLHLVGKGGLVLSDDRVAYPDTMVRMKVNPAAYDQRLFCYFWNSAIFRRQIECSARTTAGIYKINQALILAYRFPLMPLAEQRAIVEILDIQIPALDAIESDIDTNLQKAEALRQSILKKAFAGELVPQNPNDEPAAALLARLRAERATAEQAPRAARKVTRKTP